MTHLIFEILTTWTLVNVSLDNFWQVNNNNIERIIFCSGLASVKASHCLNVFVVSSSRNKNLIFNALSHKLQPTTIFTAGLE